MVVSCHVSGLIILMQSQAFKFTVDYNLPGGSAENLREAGFEAETVLQEELTKLLDGHIQDCIGGQTVVDTKSSVIWSKHS